LLSHGGCLPGIPARSREEDGVLNKEGAC
jgi:hypothetical protein